MVQHIVLSAARMGWKTVLLLGASREEPVCLGGGGAPRCARLINGNLQWIQEVALLEAALSPEGVDIKWGRRGASS